MAHIASLLQIGPRRYLDVSHALTLTLLPSTPTNIARIVEPADVADLAAVEHLTWWHSPAALAYRTGIKVEHATGLVSRWSLAESTQGRWWIALEVWADADTQVSSKQILPRHLHPTAYLAQLDGIATKAAA